MAIGRDRRWRSAASLLAHADIEFMRAKGLKLKPGAFGENLVIDGVNTDELGIGSQLRGGTGIELAFSTVRKPLYGHTALGCPPVS